MSLHLDERAFAYELRTRFSSFLDEAVEYKRLTSNHKSGTREMYEIEIERDMYRSCDMLYRHLESVRDSEDAIRMYIAGPGGKKVREGLKEIRAKNERIKNAKAKEEKRIDELKKRCKAEGLSFEAENEKYIAQSKKRRKLGWLISVILVLVWVASIVLLFVLPGAETPNGLAIEICILALIPVIIIIVIVNRICGAPITRMELAKEKIIE